MENISNEILQGSRGDADRDSRLDSVGEVAGGTS